MTSPILSAQISNWGSGVYTVEFGALLALSGEFPDYDLWVQNTGSNDVYLSGTANDYSAGYVLAAGAEFSARIPANALFYASVYPSAGATSALTVLAIQR